MALGVDAQLVESIGQKAEPGVPSSTFGGKQAQTEPRAVIRFGLLAITHHMRHVFVIVPFTAIIDQSVRVLREALTLEGEDPEEIVAALHHKAEYENYIARSLASQWSSPVIVTTSVQFFEALASNRPGALRRLHELPCSMIYIDEVHASLPAHLWRITWNWVQEIGRGG